MSDVIVVGAGIAGLQCARQLRAAGRSVTVLDRAAGVGGRCATRLVDDQPVDFGVFFLHGQDPRFWAAVEALDPALRIEGWPRRIRDTGPPCQPDAFAPFVRRLALGAGISGFAEHLADGIDVRLNTEVSGIEVASDRIEVVIAGTDRLAAKTVVLALAVEQSASLLAGFEDDETRSALALVGMFASLPCLTLIAAYGVDAPEQDWDVCYPSDSGSLMMVSNESSKRDTPGRRILVFQATARWSRERLDAPVETWQRELLEEAAARLGPWAAQPVFTHPHRWRYGRVDRCTELSSPILLRYPGDLRIGLAGDIFAAGGGVQASWLAGDLLADRLRNEES